VAADLASGKSGDALAAGAVADARSLPWRARGRYFLLCLLCYLVFGTTFLFAILTGTAAVDGGLIPLDSGSISATMWVTGLGWVIGLSLAGAIISLAFELHIPDHPRRPRGRQVAWGLVPILSFSWLAFMPFLWLADTSRRGRDWVVFAAYLTAVAVEAYLIVVGYDGSVAWTTTYVMWLLVGGTATVHALWAFRPAAEVPSWRYAHTIRMRASGGNPSSIQQPPRKGTGDQIGAGSGQDRR
jgi:hypothetical protein